ncbi:hypothetical protein D3C76_1007260 [compost metagenome]
MLIGSNGPEASRSDSGNNSGPNTSSGTSTGTANRKIAPQLKNSSNTPPTKGPSAEPTVNVVAQIATASLRSSRSSNTERISANVEGISIAPKMPIQARPAISCVAVSEYAVSTDTIAKPKDPASNNLR